jgi:hypothetical protein
VRLRVAAKTDWKKIKEISENRRSKKIVELCFLREKNVLFIK